MLVIERSQGNVCSLQKDVEAAFRERQIKIGNLSEHVTHRYIKCAPLIERKPAQIVEKIFLEAQAVLISLFQKLIAAQTQRIARLPRHMFEEAQETPAVLLLFFKPNMSVNFYELLQGLSGHLFVILSRRVIRALNAVHGDALGPQDAPYF